MSGFTKQSVISETRLITVRLFELNRVVFEISESAGSRLVMGVVCVCVCVCACVDDVTVRCHTDTGVTFLVTLH